MESMTAFQVRRPGPVATKPLVRVRCPLPEIGAGDLLVRVDACGVCRTDLHVAEGDLPVHRPRVVPGHEVVGEVVGDRAAVTRLAAGDRVGIAWLRRTCGECRLLPRGRGEPVPALAYTGWDADGGYAEYATVPRGLRLPAARRVRRR